MDIDERRQKFLIEEKERYDTITDCVVICVIVSGMLAGMTAAAWWLGLL